MKNKIKHIMTEEQIKAQKCSIILASVKQTNTIPITLLCKTPTDSSNQETKITQEIATKTNVHQRQVYLTGASPPFSITTKGLLDQKNFLSVYQAIL